MNKNYLEVKKINPDFLFLVRECEGVEPYIIARYSKPITRFWCGKKSISGQLRRCWDIKNSRKLSELGFLGELNCLEMKFIWNKLFYCTKFYKTN